jgi:hypothetical protein
LVLSASPVFSAAGNLVSIVATWAPTPTTRCSAPRATPGRPIARPAAAAAGRRWPWPCAWRPWPTAGTMAARCATRPGGTTSSDSAPASGACRNIRPASAPPGTGRRPWAWAGRWRAPWPISPCCSRSRPGGMRARRSPWRATGRCSRRPSMAT